MLLTIDFFLLINSSILFRNNCGLSALFKSWWLSFIWNLLLLLWRIRLLLFVIFDYRWLAFTFLLSSSWAWSSTSFGFWGFIFSGYDSILGANLWWVIFDFNFVVVIRFSYLLLLSTSIDFWCRVATWNSYRYSWSTSNNSKSWPSTTLCHRSWHLLVLLLLLLFLGSYRFTPHSGLS